MSKTKTVAVTVKYTPIKGGIYVQVKVGPHFYAASAATRPKAEKLASSFIAEKSREIA